MTNVKETCNGPRSVDTESSDSGPASVEVLSIDTREEVIVGKNALETEGSLNSHTIAYGSNGLYRIRQVS